MSELSSPTAPNSAQIKRGNFWRLLWLVPSGILAGVCGGALMNAFNGWISPFYFLMFSYADDPFSFDGWLLVIRHGMLEGAIFGAIFSVLYTSVVLGISRATCPLGLALRGMARAIFLLGLTSVLFGLNALLIAQWKPMWFFDFGLYDPSARGASSYNLNFLYVGASIWGIYIGGFVAVIVGCIWFSFDWRQYKKEHAL